MAPRYISPVINKQSTHTHELSPVRQNQGYLRLKNSLLAWSKFAKTRSFFATSPSRADGNMQLLASVGSHVRWSYVLMCSGTTSITSNALFLKLQVGFFFFFRRISVWFMSWILITVYGVTKIRKGTHNIVLLNMYVVCNGIFDRFYRGIQIYNLFFFPGKNINNIFKNFFWKKYIKSICSF